MEGEDIYDALHHCIYHDVPWPLVRILLPMYKEEYTSYPEALLSYLFWHDQATLSAVLDDVVERNDQSVYGALWDLIGDSADTNNQKILQQSIISISGTERP